jgi:predicted cupin superfamily sugar epimerase
MIESLGLQPHPEGGWYAETWRGAADASGRPTGTAIVFLLRTGEVSHWHRLDAPEDWHFHGGDPVEMRIHQGAATETHLLGFDLQAGQRPQVIVRAGAWQTARSTGAWSLVGCTMAPGFSFEGFELAAPGWEPE